MFPDNKYDRFTVLSNGSLLIKPVKANDVGFYVCSALSVVGSSTVKAHLNVSVSSYSFPPIIIIGPQNQSVTEGTTAVRLPCQTAGNPTPRVQWMFNDSQVSVNNRRVNFMENGDLQITSEFRLNFG